MTSQIFILTGTEGLAFWFLWADFVSIAITVILTLYVFLHSYFKGISSTVYRVLVASPIALIIPSIVFSLVSYEIKIAMSGYIMLIFILGLIGAVIPVASAIAYAVYSSSESSSAGKNYCQIHGISYDGYICPECAAEQAGQQGPTVTDIPSQEPKTKIFAPPRVKGYFINISNSKVYPLSKDMVIGRGSKQPGDTSKVAIDGDGYISRTHSRVIFDGNKYRISDSSSKSGTLVNGQVIRGWVTLTDGDIVKVGKTSLKFTQSK